MKPESPGYDVRRLQVQEGPNGEKDPADYWNSPPDEFRVNIGMDPSPDDSEKAEQPKLDIRTVGPDFLGKKRKARPFVYRKQYIRGKVTAIGGPGGVGKSMYELQTFISMAIGRDLLAPGCPPIRQRKVLLINNEDELEELELRIEAIMRKHHIRSDDLGDRFMFASGYHEQIRLAMRAHVAGADCFVATEIFREIEKIVTDGGIDVVGCDPLVSLHDAKENDNGEMDQVMAVIKAMAARTRVAFVLLHHTSKNAEATSIDNSLRGASAVVNAARCVITFTRMTEKERMRTSIKPEDRTRYVCAHHGKSNMTLPIAVGEWYCLQSYGIDVVGEGGEDDVEFVGVMMPVDMAELMKSDDDDDDDDGDPTKKWTATRVAEAIEPSLKGVSSVRVKDIVDQVALTLGLGKKRAGEVLNRIPMGKENAKTILKNGIQVRYWREKDSHRTALVTIFREELR